eukprot:2913506-Ditylum_brightwellii.AAC.1
MACLDTMQSITTQGFFSSHTFFFWWGCNNDTQKLLVGNVLYKRVTDRGQSYEEYMRKLIAAGRLGLANYTAIKNIEEYLVGYFCKGGSMMNSSTKSKSFTRDEDSYFLGGGV